MRKSEKKIDLQDTMRAFVCTKYGPPEVLQMSRTRKPVPKHDEILIKIKTTAVNSGDVRVRSLAVNGPMRIVMSIVLGFFGPRKQILGTVYSGVVVEVGKKIKLFKPGEEVFGMTGFKFGTYAEYLTVKESSAVSLKPLNASFEEAAAILFGGSTSIYFLSKANIDASANKKVLIYGATGSVGTSAIQISKHYNAVVTAVCSREGLDLVKSLGADDVLDYMDANFINSVEKYDIIFDAVGKIKQKDWSQFLSQDGIYISVGHLDVASESREQLLFLKDLFDSDQLSAVIDRIYNFDEMIEAHRYVDTGRKKGNVVVRINGELS